MDILSPLAEIIEEFGFEVVKRHFGKFITFKPKNILNTVDNYKLTIKGSDVRISRLFIIFKDKDDFCVIPDNKILLSVDLHDPHSLKTIRDWLESL